MAQATMTRRKSGGANGRRRNGSSGQTDGLAASFLAEVAEPVRDLLAAATDLDVFLQGAGTLTLNERRLLVEQALVMLEQNYVHLPFKVAMHAVSPVQRLRLLRVHLDRQTPSTMGPEWKFHAEMSEIFHSVRDLHTNYLLPVPYAGKIAFMPFQIEQFFDTNGPQYVVTRIVQGFSAPGLGAGARVTHWNGVPIDRAVDINADRFAGSNIAARRARGVDSLTVRSLRIHLPPDEQWVTVTYIGIDNVEHELRQNWLIADNLPPFVAAANDLSPVATAQGLDIEGDETSRAKILLFAPQVVAQRRDPDLAAQAVALAAGVDVPTTMPGIFRARSVVTSSGTFGHIRIFTFNVQNPGAFVDEFVRLIGLLPQNGLIVDVRANGGGHVHASEFTLQTLTPRHITPEPTQFINTQLNLKIVNRHKDNGSGIDLGPWFPSMDQATETGAAFSGAFAITPEEGANILGQQYFGPVVLVTDARCYSATDIFAAGFKDHAIGTILGVDDNTGAGGANVWEHNLLKLLMELPSPAADTPYKALPKQANMRVAIRRTLRVGAAVGTPVEDLGVLPDEIHKMTRNDVLNGNVDLLNRAGQILGAAPLRKLDVTVTTAADGTLTLTIDAANIDRVDVYGGGRPRASLDLAAPPVPVMLPGLPAAGTVRVEGFADGKLVASRTIET